MTLLQKKAYVFGTIFTLANKMQVLGDRFDKNITTKQWLFILGVSTFREPPMISELANFIGYSRQNAKRIAVSLQERGYIGITKDKTDARALRVELTPKCREYFEKRNRREIGFLNKLFTGFDAESTHNVYQGLIKLEHNIEEMFKQEDIDDLEDPI